MAKKTSLKYTIPVVATDVAIFTVREDQLHVLLIKMNRPPYTGYWALPGGLIKTNETLAEAASRHLEEETNVPGDEIFLEQLEAFSALNRDPQGRVVSVAYYALIPSDRFKLKTTAAYAGVDWFPVDKLPKLAYDHKTIAEHALQRLRQKLRYSNIAYSLMPPEFTLSEIQKTYEIILGRKLDKRNFRKKLLQISMITDAKKIQTGRANRPARLFSFTKKQAEYVDFL